jgi:hypothetical protein
MTQTFFELLCRINAGRAQRLSGQQLHACQ